YGRDFVPVFLVSQAPAILVVTPSAPVKTVGELISLAKSSPHGHQHGLGGVLLIVASVPGNFQGLSGRFGASRAVSRRRAGDQRSDVRPCKILFWQRGHRDRTDQGREAKGTCAYLERRPRRVAGYSADFRYVSRF